MEHYQKCPICNKNNIYTYYTGPFGIEEEYYRCENCGYVNEFSYGGELTVVKGKVFTTWYGEKYNKKAQIDKKINKAMYEAKRNYKKRKKTYLQKD